MSKNLDRIVTIIELVIIIMVCKIVLENMTNMPGAIEAANNGDLNPAEDVFKNMANELKSINIDKFFETVKDIGNTILEKLGNIHISVSID